MVAFYLYFLPIDGEPAVGIMLALAVLTFVPSRYPYPTRPGRVNRWMLVMIVPWTVLVLLSLLNGLEEVRRNLIYVSVLYPAFYLGVAWAMSVRRLLSKRPSLAFLLNTPVTIPRFSLPLLSELPCPLFERY